MRGLFLALEGPEGAGKSSQVALLTRRLSQQRIEHLVTREPGGSPAGERVREVLLDPTLRLEPLSELLLYAAARAQHVAEVIAPALESGRLVITDRFRAATVAYQGYGRGLDLRFVKELNERVTGGLKPDLIILLDAPAEVGLERVASRGETDRLERADLEFHRRVREGFLAQAGEEPSLWRTIDAQREEGAVARDVWAMVSAAVSAWRAA